MPVGSVDAAPSAIPDVFEYLSIQIAALGSSELQSSQEHPRCNVLFERPLFTLIYIFFLISFFHMLCLLFFNLNPISNNVEGIFLGQILATEANLAQNSAQT